MKKNKLKIILYTIAVIIVLVLLIWKYTHKPNKDLSDSKPVSSYTFTNLIDKIEKDTTGLRNMIIAVNGHVKKISSDSTGVSIELGYDSIMSTVTCDIDKRHSSDFEKIKQGDEISIKGLVTELTVDPESIFGNTVNMAFCVKNK